MDRARYIELLAEDGALLLQAARATDLDNPVPPCPGWTVRDAVTHTADVYVDKMTIISLRGGKTETWPPERPDGWEPISYYEQSLNRLLDTFATMDDDAPAATWWPSDNKAGLWVRRMAQETCVHRYDVQTGAGSVTPVDAELATDGVDEILKLFLVGPWWDDDKWEQPDLCGKYVVSTGGRTWQAVMEPRKVTVTEDVEGEADATISGDPSNVLLWLWGRVPESDVTIEGDASKFRQRLALVGD